MTQPPGPSKYFRITAGPKDAQVIRLKPGEAGPAAPDMVGPIKNFRWFLIPGGTAQPGSNLVDIDLASLGIGTPWMVSASATEVILPNTPHIGAAVIQTVGVRLDQQAGLAVVEFDLQWNWPLPVSLMTFVGFT
jgi:hypothetical protein